MNIKSWALIVTILSFLFQLTNIQANNFSKKYEIQWKESSKIEISPDKFIEFINFEGAIPSEIYPTLPLYFDKIAVENFFSSYEVKISNIQTTTFTSAEAQLIPSQFSQKDLNVEVRTETANGKHFTTLRFIPILGENGKYQKITSCQITVQGTKIKNAKSSTQKTKNQSILSNGTWHKISVTESGIHKITYTELANMGILNGSINSNSIAIFGNGGGMLSESNSDPRPDDLQELPIWIEDGGDGIFNTGDYILFYAQGPHTWSYNYTTQKFSHKFNIYDSAAYYFITTTPGISSPKRISIQNFTAETASQTYNTFIHYQFYEKDLFNFGESGRQWVDEGFDIITQRTYNIILPNITANGGQLTVCAGSRTAASSYFDISANNNNIGRMNLNGIVGDDLLKMTTRTFNFSNLPNNTSLQFTYNKPLASSVAHLDWFEIQAECYLSMYKGQVPFCHPNSFNNNKFCEFQIDNATPKTIVWNITDCCNPTQMQGSFDGNKFRFTAPTDTLYHYIAFNGNTFFNVQYIGPVNNQNLHNSTAELIIISHPDFLEQAQRLAKHKIADGISTFVATTEQVYNEYSSGALDPTAIRDYMRQMYLKTNGTYPKYLLLIGRPSYDYRGINEGTKCYIPNYQYSMEVNEKYFRSFDDYFGLLDDEEGLVGTYLRGLIDVAVGRFPASNIQQARIAVQKSIDYSTKTDLTKGNTNLISNLADWRNIITFVADDEDANEHVIVSEACANTIKRNFPQFNFDKIYCDAYQQVSHAGGQRYPEVNTAINNRMNRGALLYSYIGHSSGASWAHERILEISDINKWTNRYNQPLITTMSCEFGWYDRKAISPAELTFFNENGGGIGLITTSRVAYIGPNATYIKSLANSIFFPVDGHKQTLGEINKLAKNNMGGVAESINMIYLIGDPSLPINIPEYQIVTDSINGTSIHTSTDTLKALTQVNIKGRITDKEGNTLENFDGNLYPSVYDKATRTRTLLNDMSGIDIEPFEFEEQKSILFKGNVSVSQGHFAFSFIIPKDINYAYGEGKLSYYAKSNHTDAAGATPVLIGGISDNPIVDEQGPEIEIYLNNENFVNGGTTTQDALLLVKLRDEKGINTTGNGIGHDLVAILDNNTEKQIILNEYYLAAQDSFNCGTVRYPLTQLSEGKHTLTVRAWDIANNVAESSIDFTVVSNEDFSLHHLLNYPNPFTTHTDFYFEHNRNGSTLDIVIQIFTISGKLVKTITQTQYANGNRSTAIPWDGRDDFGDKLGKGVYVYKIKVRNTEGEIAEKIEKIVIL